MHRAHPKNAVQRVIREISPYRRYHCHACDAYSWRWAGLHFSIADKEYPVWLIAVLVFGGTVFSPIHREHKRVWHGGLAVIGVCCTVNKIIHSSPGDICQGWFVFGPRLLQLGCNSPSLSGRNNPLESGAGFEEQSF